MLSYIRKPMLYICSGYNVDASKSATATSVIAVNNEHRDGTNDKTMMKLSENYLH
jgi:hypothetical protein